MSERKYLRELTDAVIDFLHALDAEQAKPSDEQRWKRIAALANALDLANDRARYFGLGIDFRTDTKARKQPAASVSAGEEA